MRAHLLGISVLPALLSLAIALGSPGCSLEKTGFESDDLSAPVPTDLGARLVPAAAFQDCTPAGFSDAPCQSGLRCGLIRIGEPPAMAALAQCVPVIAQPLAEDEACDYTETAPAGQSGVTKRYDRCGPGLGCVPTASQGLRCKPLCALRVRGACGKDRLCVIPAPVTGVGYCAPSDKCQPVFPQTGCPRDGGGQSLGCYVLGDDKGTGTFCMARVPYGASTGDLDAVCERSPNCLPGMACASRNGRDQTCRPYCTLPEVPDGGTAPEVKCAADLGTCRAVAGYETVGRCL